MQLSSALSNPEAMKGLQYNPLLYYTYYAQVQHFFYTKRNNKKKIEDEKLYNKTEKMK